MAQYPNEEIVPESKTRPQSWGERWSGDGGNAWRGDTDQSGWTGSQWPGWSGGWGGCGETGTAETPGSASSASGEAGTAETPGSAPGHNENNLHDV